MLEAGQRWRLMEEQVDQPSVACMVLMQQLLDTVVEHAEVLLVVVQGSK